MKNRHRISVAAAVVALAVAASLPGAGATPNPAWDRLKSLVGEWEGTYSGPDEHGTVALSYRLVSNGTTLMETMRSGHDADMITMYSPDGASLVATHYCSEGNQPRMRADASSAGAVRIVFRFVDATNLPDPDAIHMRSLVVMFEGPDRFRQEWTSRAGDKDQTGIFEYRRKK
jgi:hypothetical protein